MNIANTAMYCAITFIAQGILIYRCWMLWGRHLLVISIPSILAWVSFGTSLAMIGGLMEPSSFRFPDADMTKPWYYSLSTAAFSASIGVNAILAILLATRTSMLMLEARRTLTVQKRRVHPIRQMIAVLNESGMLMLGCQIIWLVLFRRRLPAFLLVRGPIVMIYGLTPTLILQRIPHSTGQMSQNSAKEKPTADRATTIRFAI
jgi:hypothetical protein